MLAEIGDDRSRFADARALKAYAGSAPITRASGKSLVVHHRKVKNQRLAAAGYVWAFASLRAPGPRAHYDRRRAEGDRAVCTTASRRARPMTNTWPFRRAWRLPLDALTQVECVRTRVDFATCR